MPPISFSCVIHVSKYQRCIVEMREGSSNFHHFISTYIELQFVVFLPFGLFWKESSGHFCKLLGSSPPLNNLVIVNLANFIAHTLAPDHLFVFVWLLYCLSGYKARSFMKDLGSMSLKCRGPCSLAARVPHLFQVHGACLFVGVLEKGRCSPFQTHPIWEIFKRWNPFRCPHGALPSCFLFLHWLGQRWK